MRIEIYSDIVCPWCYVGYVRLQQALAERPAVTAEVIWLPYQLSPDMPEQGRNRREYLQERFGNADHFAAAQQQLTALGTELGIDFRFEAIERSPNTLRAHLLLAAARRESAEVQNELKRRLFAAYFTEARDVGDPQVLVSLAEQSGLEPEVARQALTDPALRAEVEQWQQLARQWRIGGVPSFIFDRRGTFSGAQPVEVFLRAIDFCSTKLES